MNAIQFFDWGKVNYNRFTITIKNFFLNPEYTFIEGIIPQMNNANIISFGFGSNDGNANAAPNDRKIVRKKFYKEGKDLKIIISNNYMSSVFNFSFFWFDFITVGIVHDYNRSVYTKGTLYINNRKVKYKEDTPQMLDRPIIVVRNNGFFNIQFRQNTGKHDVFTYEDDGSIVKVGDVLRGKIIFTMQNYE